MIKVRQTYCLKECNKIFTINTKDEHANICGVVGRYSIIFPLIQILSGTIIFFSMYGLIARGETVLGTLLAATISGVVGLFFSTAWIGKCRRGKLVQSLFIIAFIARIAVGIWCYLVENDPDYFSKDGFFVTTNWEFLWTYENASYAANSLSFGEWLPTTIFNNGENKNPNIHAWMGYFLAAGGERHALDLAPFNSFHHVIAGVLCLSLSLLKGFSWRVSYISGILIAWIPWAFPASLMWRDSIGIAWMVLSIYLVVLGRMYGKVSTLLVAIPALFLAYSVREVYVLIVVFALLYEVVIQDGYDFVKIQIRKILKYVILLTVLVSIMVIVVPALREMIFYRYNNVGEFSLQRLMVLPLLVIRALAGPFPWFGSNFELYIIFDYLYHVIQLAVFIMLIKNYRFILTNLNLLFFVSSAIWFSGIIAWGVHTAYLAVAMPFLLPVVLAGNDRSWPSIVVSIMIFISGNAIYFISGLHGSGMLMNATGY